MRFLEFSIWSFEFYVTKWIALHVCENDGCSLNKTKWKKIKYSKWEFSFYFYLAMPFPIRTNESILIVRKYWDFWFDGRSSLIYPIPYDSYHMIWGFILFYRDIQLNEVCKELCVEKTLTCISNCDPTDSECISDCLRADLTCGDRKYQRHIITIWSTDSETPY